ncbi:MAG: hypothetical protein Q8M44_04995, partial [bacterium]|nr:hypothetical protein [bacterium]
MLIIIQSLLIIHLTISHCFIQAFSEILHSSGESTNQFSFDNNQDFIDCSYVGISFKSRLVSIFVFIQIGLTHIKNNIVKINDASKKFIKTQARIMIACCQAGLFIRLYPALFSFNLSRIILESSTDIFIFSELYTAIHFSKSFSKFSLLYNSQLDLYTKKEFGISPVNFTNHQIGNQFNEYRVHFLSVKSFFALGGIHNQNSSTFTQKNLAVEKCHN